MVSFNQIQPFWKLPGVSIEVDPSQAGTPVNPKYGLLVGIAKGGTAPVDTPIAVGTQTDANAFFGVGSMLARMFAKWFSLNKSQILFALPLVLRRLEPLLSLLPPLWRARSRFMLRDKR
jgi:phage tail sheath gpL-like